MKTVIVCGLLGSGKTTFIRQFVRTVSGKVVVLVNDFGKMGIDGEVFSADGIESIELPSGCVCCTLKFDMITTIERIINQFSPAHLLIEPSGVASPSAVLEILESLAIRPVTVVGLVDATEFIELYESQMYGNFFEDQILNSDIILVNKTDLVGQEVTGGTIKIVEEMNPRAVTFRTVNARIAEPLPEVSAGHRTIQRKASSFVFDSFSLRLNGPVAFSLFKHFFDEIPSGRFGSVVRAKALVQTDEGPYRFDLSYGKVDSTAFGRPIDDGRLVIIGEDLQREAIAQQIGDIA